MKKSIIKIMALALVAVMTCFAFVSCSNAPSGTYGNEDVALRFSGSKVEVVYGENGKETTVTGTFEMGEDEKGNEIIIIDLPEPSSVLDIEYSIIRYAFNGERSYNAGSDNGGSYIEIGGVKLYKK